MEQIEVVTADTSTQESAPPSTWDIPETLAPANTTEPPAAPTSITERTTTSVGPQSTSPASVSPGLSILQLLIVEPEYSSGYSRDLFKHWITRNGCTTRQSVLIRDATRPPQIDIFGCTVVEGDWISPYDGAEWIFPSDLDIDHVVALKEAWESGAWAWTPERREAFANDLTDPRTLKAVTDNINQSKSDSDPSQWLPPLESYVCSYIADWVAIKARWGLSIDPVERDALAELFADECSTKEIPPWSGMPT